MTTGDAVDRLYQAPLAEFTAKRNELLKQATGAEKNELRQIQKPTVPAWAVNQLFWKRRKIFDRLIEAARKVRVEHGRQLSGKGAEVEVTESRHREAMKAATDEIRALLKAAGEQDTPATMVAVSETLQGLPGHENQYGRLSRPLKPQGFEALAGLVSRSGATIARLAEVAKPPVRRPGPEPRQSGADGRDTRAEAARRKRESQAHAKAQAKETATLERQLHKAEADERAARAEFSRAEMALARLQRERKELQDRVDTITSRRDQAAIDLDERKRQADRAAAERERLALALKGRSRD